MSQLDVSVEPQRSAGTPAKPGGRRVWAWVVGVGCLLVLLTGTALCALLGISMSARSPGGLSEWAFLGGDAVGLIYIEGVIGTGISGTVGAVDTQAVLDYVREADANQRVKAIVVYINSPGGAPLPSDLMYRALRGANKPVVAAMGDVAASGGVGRTLPRSTI